MAAVDIPWCRLVVRPLQHGPIKYLSGVADDIAELLTAIVGRKTDFWSK